MSKFIALGLAAALSGLLLAMFSSGLTSVEERAGALGWTLSPDQTPEERVTLVVIDEASIAEVGPWPWERADMARLVDAIDQAGAQLQLFDIVLPESRPGDEALIASLQNANGAVLAQIPDLNGGTGIAPVGVMTHGFTGASCESPTPVQMPNASTYVAPAANFAAIPKGHIGAPIEKDGAVRHSPALVCQGGQAFPSLAIAAFLQLSNSASWSGEINPGNSLFGPQAVMSLSAYPGLDIPLDAKGRMRISFEKAPEAFAAISAADVMAGRYDPAMLEDAWVLIGSTAFGMGDIVPTPYSGAVQGVELQARLLTSLLDVNVPYTPAGAIFFTLLLCAVFAAALMALAIVGDRVAAYGLPVAALVMPTLALGLHSLILGLSNIWIGWIGSALFGTVAAASLLLLEMARVRMERSQVFGNLNSYLPDDIAREIAYALPNANVNAHRRNVTLLNADLRNFSAFGEARPPEETAAVLHYFYTRATAIIERHGGSVQEFKGDSLLAMWDGADSAEARKALCTARELQKDLNDTLLPEHAISGLEPLALGIGIEQGPVLIGSIGPAHRRSLTMLGDTLSITLRIQEMTAELAQPILVGECIARQLSDEKLESQGSYLLSGLRIPHTLFAPAHGHAAKPLVSMKNQPALTVLSGGKR